MAHLGNSPASRDIESLIHPYTNLQRHRSDGPVIISEGKGIYVYDDAGTEYIEGLAGLWCTSLGYDEERLIEAATSAMRKLAYSHTFNHKSHEPGIDLAERLLEMAPVPMSKVFFANSGSEANDTAIKLVWYYNNALGRPEKKKIISRIKGYHGVTALAASLTGLPHLHMDFDLPLGPILHADCPHHYRFAEEGESEEDFATRLAENLESLILEEGPDTVAAFIAEPVMGAGGVVPPPATYFDKIQPILRKYDILFIADEVICGFGRTGNMFGSQTYNLKPDMITVAKALSSAYLPISALMVSEPIYQAMLTESEKIGTFGHGYTYSGHPVCAAVALETLQIYDERDIVSHVRNVTPAFQNGLAAFSDHPLVGEVRGVGLIAAVELVPDKATSSAFQNPGQVGGYCAKQCEAHGLIVRNLADAVALCPPLVISEAQIADMMVRLGAAIEDTHAWVREEELVA